MKSGLIQPKSDQLARSLNENFEETYAQPEHDPDVNCVNRKEETLRLIQQYLVEQGYAEIAE